MEEVASLASTIKEIAKHTNVTKKLKKFN